MSNWITKMWLILAAAALLSGTVVWITEGMMFGKAYTFFILAVVCLLLWKYKKNLIG